MPDEDTCIEVDQIIFDELTRGVFTDASRERFVGIMNDLKARGADAAALSCPEIGLLVSPETALLPAIDCRCDCGVDDGGGACNGSRVTR